MKHQELKSIPMNLVKEAQERLQNTVKKSPLMYMENISDEYMSDIYFKREDLQTVRSYKIRGAYNKISSLTIEERTNRIVCASAGNHAQGFALSCSSLGIKGAIFMPSTTPKQKINQVKFFGKNWVEIHLIGDTYDSSYEAALVFSKQHQAIFIHPFDDPKVIAGQATIALEILESSTKQIDYLILPIGGGGLAAGVSSVFKKISPSTKVIAVEPKGASSFTYSLEQGSNSSLDSIDKFIDGAAVKRMGSITYPICKANIDQVICVDEGHVCTSLLRVYNENAIVVEPAGALSIAALDHLSDEIKGKQVVCIISGGNNDILRMEEIKERSLLFEGLKHYFVVNFSQRAGSLKEFLLHVLGPNDDITYFQYLKKNNRENGSAVLGIELSDRRDFQGLIDRMKDQKFLEHYLNDQPELFNYLV